MTATVEVRFKGIRKEYYRWQETVEDVLRLKEPVIVEAERGFDFGHVTAVGDHAAQKCGGCSGCGTEDPKDPKGPSLKAIIRRASPDDVQQATDLRQGEDDIRRRVAERARSHGLELKISDAEWQWDRKKLTVFFTAEQRVDFRGLVRELAAQYHTRIDLRQIGVRDEAARLSGVGRCGREYCCSTWLTELSPVSLSLAKDQHLSLNPSQISGGCGRLLCCLRYEHEFYVAQRKRFPREGKMIRTARGPEKVSAVDIFRERVSLRHAEDGPRTIGLAELQVELEAVASGTVVVPTAPIPREPRAPAGARDPRGPAKSHPAPPTRPEPEAAKPAPATEPAAETPAAKPARKRRRRRRGPRGKGSDGSTPS